MWKFQIGKRIVHKGEGMEFDIYSLIQSVEVREYLRKWRKFKLLEQDVIIRNSYYTIEQKLKFIKQLVEVTRKDRRNEKELKVLEEKAALYEFIVNFIYNPRADVIYMAQEESRGYNVCYKDNDYRLSEKVFTDTHYFKNIEDIKKYWEHNTKSEYTVRVDMVLLSEQGAKYNVDEIVQPVWFDIRILKGGKLSIRNFGIDEKWFLKNGFSKECVGKRFGKFRCPLPFEHGSRVRLQTPDMREPIYGILDSSFDYGGLWYHFLWVEDEQHDFYILRKLLQEEKLDCQEVDVIDLSYPILNMCSDFLSYDWIERADEDSLYILEDGLDKSDYRGMSLVKFKETSAD